MARPPLPIGTSGRVRTYRTQAGWRSRTTCSDYDGITREVRCAAAARPSPSGAQRLLYASGVRRRRFGAQQLGDHRGVLVDPDRDAVSGRIQDMHVWVRQRPSQPELPAQPRPPPPGRECSGHRRAPTGPAGRAATTPGDWRWNASVVRRQHPARTRARSVIDYA